MLRRSLLALALMLSVPVVALAATTDGPTPTGVEVGELLSEFAATACTHNCDTVCVVSTEHKVLENPGNALGPDHSFLYTQLGCGYHDCIEEQQQDVEQLVELLPDLGGAELVAFSLQDIGLTINRDRGAIQVIGCNDLVVASVPLSQAQADWLAADR
jgi:hypothetical protein